MENEQILEALGTLIGTRPDVVEMYLALNGYELPEEYNGDDMAETARHALINSKPFAQQISREIAQMFEGSDVYSGDGGGQNIDYGQMATATASIMQSLGNLFGKKQDAPQIQPYIPAPAPAPSQVSVGLGFTTDQMLIAGAIGISLIAAITIVIIKNRS